MWWMLRGFGRGLRNGLVAVGALFFSGGVIAFANYQATVGSGTNFGSVVIGGVHFVSMLICDLTTANQCASVSAGGALKVDNSAVTQPANISQMGGTTINSGCVGAINGFPVALPATVCPAVASYVINNTTPGQATMANSLPVTMASNQTQIQVDGIVNPSSNFTRLANATPYASGQLIANSATPGSVVPLSWTVARVNGGGFYIRRVHMTLSGKSVTNTNFRIHFYTVTPTIANGDGGAWSTTLANYFCRMDVTVGEAGTDVSHGVGTPTAGDGNECNLVAAGGTQTIYGLVEARAAYTPTSGETITVIPEIHQM